MCEVHVQDSSRASCAKFLYLMRAEEGTQVQNLFFVDQFDFVALFFRLCPNFKTDLLKNNYSKPNSCSYMTFTNFCELVILFSRGQKH